MRLSVALLFGATACTTAPRQDDEAAIRGALTTWMADFNAGRADHACGLFARELRFDFQGQPERGYPEMCDQLHRALSNPSRHYSYSLDIKEVLFGEELAIVRLTWRLTVRRTDQPDVTTEEPGLDVFRRQADGSWKIIRFMAYEVGA